MTTTPDLARITDLLEAAGISIAYGATDPDGSIEFTVDPEVYRHDTESDYLAFGWGREHGWYVDSQCAPSIPVMVKLGLPDDASPERVVDAVREYLAGDGEYERVTP